MPGKLSDERQLFVELTFDSNPLDRYITLCLDAAFRLLTRAIGFNVTLVETHFRGNGKDFNQRQNEMDGPSASGSGSKPIKRVESPSLLQDIFVTCSMDRERNYALSINLELINPFEVVDVYYEIPTTVITKGEDLLDRGRSNGGLFRIHLSQSTFLVQLNQRIRYDDCLAINYIQLAPNVDYVIECVGCGEEQSQHLDKIFSKRMTQLDAELDAMLSEKLLLGLQILFNQQRLELDLFVE